MRPRLHIERDAARFVTDFFLKERPAMFPQAVRAAQQLVCDVAGKEFSAELMEHTSDQIAAIRVSDEGQEGLKAFLEKRKPSWLTE